MKNRTLESYQSELRMYKNIGNTFSPLHGKEKAISEIENKELRELLEKLLERKNLLFPLTSDGLDEASQKIAYDKLQINDKYFENLKKETKDLLKSVEKCTDKSFVLTEEWRAFNTALTATENVIAKNTVIKHEDFFREMSKEKKAEIKNKIEVAYKNIINLKEQEREETKVVISKETEEFNNKNKILIKNGKGKTLFDISMAGPFTLHEIMEKLGMDYGNKDKEALLRAMNECMDVTTYNLVEKENGDFVLGYSQKMQEDMAAIERGDEKYMLTRWDKFCNFFGIKTEHVRAIETSIAAVNAYKEKQAAMNKDLLISQTIQQKETLIQTGKDLYNSVKTITSAAHNTMAGWRNIFFGDNWPKEYTTNDGRKISPVSLCMALLHQRNNLDFSAMSPKACEEIMKNDEKLRKDIEIIGKTVAKVIKAKEDVINANQNIKNVATAFNIKTESRDYDAELKALLKPTNARRLGYSQAAEYVAEKHEESKRKEIFGNGYVMLKVREDMAKFFGSEDEIYSQANSFEQEFEKQIKNTFGAVNLYEAIVQNKYDEALKISPDGHGDYNNLKTVVSKSKKALQVMNDTFNKKIGANIKAVSYSVNNAAAAPKQPEEPKQPEADEHVMQ